MLDQIEIINIFTREFNRELTINQISKLIEKSYAFTNKNVHELIASGILNRKIIGSALLCSLNYENKKTTALLAIASMHKKTEFDEKLNQDKKQSLNTFIDFFDDHLIHTIYLENTNLTVVCENKDEFSNLKTAGFKIKLATKKEFIASAKNIDFSKIIVIKNHEAFWNILSKQK